MPFAWLMIGVSSVTTFLFLGLLHLNMVISFWIDNNIIPGWRIICYLHIMPFWNCYYSMNHMLFAHFAILELLLFNVVCSFYIINAVLQVLYVILSRSYWISWQGTNRRPLHSQGICSEHQFSGSFGHTLLIQFPRCWKLLSVQSCCLEAVTKRQRYLFAALPIEKIQ